MSEGVQVGRRRQQRGTERRQAIVEAAVRIIQQDGLEGVTHRRVADEAGVPLAATTYYFSSKEDLMQAAAEHLVAEDAARVRTIAEAVADAGTMTLEQGVEALIVWQTTLLRERRMAQFAEFEVALRTGRMGGPPSDQPPWPAAFREVASNALAALGAPDPERDAYELVALIHGLVLHALASGDEDFGERVLAPIVREWFVRKLG